MRVVIEVDNDKELKKAEKLVRYLNPSEITIKDRIKKIRSFLSYTDKTATPVRKVIIPSREERNVR